MLRCKRGGLCLGLLVACLMLAGPADRVDGAGRRNSRGCCDTITRTLTVCHPCTGCKLNVDVCVPACCTDCPCESFRRTVFGCGASTFRFCCGYAVVIRYQRCGSVRVVYRG